VRLPQHALSKEAGRVHTCTLLLLSFMMQPAIAADMSGIHFGWAMQGPGLYITSEGMPLDGAVDRSFTVFEAVSGATNQLVVEFSVVNGYSNCVFLCVDTNVVLGPPEVRSYTEAGMCVDQYGLGPVLLGSFGRNYVKLGRHVNVRHGDTNVVHDTIFNSYCFVHRFVWYCPPQDQSNGNLGNDPASLDHLLTDRYLPPETRRIDIIVPVLLKYYVVGDQQEVEKNIELKCRVRVKQASTD